MKLVDEDGSEMIEFGEFLSIIKGGSNAVFNFNILTHLYRKNQKRVQQQQEQGLFILSSKN